MRKILITIVLMAAMAVLAGCSAGEFGLVFDDEGTSCTITADNAGEGDYAMAGTLIVKEGDEVVVEPAFEGEGQVQIQLAAAVAEESEDDAEEFELEDIVLDEKVGGSEPVHLEVAPGEYMLKATASKGLTGTALVKASAPAAEEAAQPAKEETTAAEAEDGQNPVMNVIGDYASGRASIHIDAGEGHAASASVSWSSSAAEHSEWTMSGTFNSDTHTFEYTGCTKKNFVYAEDGSVESEETVYTDGTGRMVFSEDPLSLTWEDDKENAADGMTFTYSN